MIQEMQTEVRSTSMPLFPKARINMSPPTKSSQLPLPNEPIKESKPFTSIVTNGLVSLMFLLSFFLCVDQWILPCFFHFFQRLETSRPSYLLFCLSFVLRSSPGCFFVQNLMGSLNASNWLELALESLISFLSMT